MTGALGRVHAWVVAALVLPALLAGCGEEAGGDHRPHVVLIVVDTLRADHLGQYGYDRATSPKLDAFAARATRFSSCWAPASWTTPSTASLFTGLLPMRHGTWARGAALPDEALTLAELMQAAGWRTVGISYNHNITVTTNFQQGFEWFEDFEGENEAYPHIEAMRESVSRLRFAADRPVFLYLQPMNVHGPYRVPKARRDDLLGARPDDTFEYSKGLMKKIMKKGQLERRGEVDEKYLASHRDQYDTAIRYSTDEIAGMLESLEAGGVYDDALIIITADHGEELYDHQGFGHGYTLHPELLHVPLLVKMPGQTGPRVIEERVSLTDVFATILEAAEVPVPAGIDARSLVSMLGVDGADEAALPAVPEIAETRWPGRFVGASVVWMPWKLVHIEESYEGVKDAYRLYHLEDDPRERENVAAAHPDVVERLRRHLAERRAAAVEMTAENVEDHMDRDVLKSLGYLD